MPSGYKLSRIYVWEDLVRPHEIWPDTTYYIDLAWSSSSAVTSAWWTFNGNSTPSFNSVWAYGGSNGKYTIAKSLGGSGSLSNYSKVRITTNFYMVVWWWYWDIWCGSLWTGNQAGNYWYQSKIYTYNGGSWQWVLTSISDTKKTIDVVATPSWNYTCVTEFDLTTWDMTVTLSWDASWTTTYTMTSSELSTLKSSYTFAWAWFESASSWTWTNGHKIKDIKIELWN